MSNFLAVANVTLALRNLLEDVLDDDVGGAQVSMVRPGESAATPATGANIFLYRASPNAAWRNDDLPARRSDGTLARKPTAAIDLHYLISFYGDDKSLETHRLLGSAVRTLHSWPTLDRETLRSAALASYLAGSNIAEAVECVRLTPANLDLEELSKLWSVLFQTPYVLSVAYDASVVLIESDDAPQPSLPVRARNVYVSTIGQPVIERVTNLDGPNEPITTTSTLLIEGRRLKADVTVLRIGPEGNEFTPADIADRRATFSLGSLSAGQRRAGIQGVQVVQRRLMGTPPTAHTGTESNVVPFVLRPTIDPPSPPVPGQDFDIVFTPASGSGATATAATVDVTLTPTVGKAQRAVLVLNRLAAGGAGARSFVAKPRATDAKTITFETPDLPAGNYLVRVQIDGAESLLRADATGAYTQPRVAIP